MKNRDTRGPGRLRRGFRAWIGRAVVAAWCWIGSAAFVASFVQGAAQSADRIAFDAGRRDFDNGLWDRVVQEFTGFEATFPRSALRPEAGELKAFAQGEAAADRGEHRVAADFFAQFRQAFPAAPRAGLAAVREAAARAKLGDPRGAVDVLATPDGAFARLLAAGTQPAVVFRGLLLQAEAHLALSDRTAAEASLTAAAKMSRSPAEEWGRLRLLVTVLDAAGKPAAAAETATSLLGIAGREASLASRRAESASLAGGLWLKQGDADRAAAAFTVNVAPGTPMELYREATFRLVGWRLARGELAAARERLEAFTGSHPGDTEINRVRLLSGQTLFRQHLAARGGTNAAEAAALLALASGQFQAALTNAPAAGLAGPLLLGRGWVLWEEGLSGNVVARVSAAETDFIGAVAVLPHGPDRAVAQFKAADCQMWRGNVAGALTNYLAVSDGYADVPEVVAELTGPAAQQAVLAATQVGDRVSAERALAKLMAMDAAGRPAARSTLLLGQSLAKTGDVGRARALLSGFLAKFPDSPQGTEVRLALIAADLRARDWTNAMSQLDAWIAANTNHPALPRAESDRAWATAQAGFTGEAVARFAALAAHHPTNALVPRAQLWLAGHFFNHGDFARAEAACQVLATNKVWRVTPEGQRARFWAADAARRRQSFASARDQLLDLLNDPATPEALMPAAYFALGELRSEQPPEDPARPLDNFRLALEAFAKTAQFTNAPQAVPALGKMADCNLQFATQDTNRLARAAELYQQVLDSKGADLATRCKASIGIGLVAEKVAQRSGSAEVAAGTGMALDRYLDVAHGKLRRPGEIMDPWWVKEAGREAGRVLEVSGRWKEASSLYEWLAQELPSQQAAWRVRATAARSRAGG